jgi:peroxiredoxin family protein
LTLELFEFDRDDLIDGLEYAGAGTYIDRAHGASINLFI